MHRFPNPSSTVGNFVAVFVATFEQYRDRVFDLDHIIKAAVLANLATSSGHMGEMAIVRSTRTDRSRDPLYNQMKMYAELFRLLGWLRSTEDSALRYTFTLLGEQLIAAKRDWRPLFGETVLGIAYPSHVLKVRHGHSIRPFAAIMRTMRACDGGLSRDEMIIGPLSAVSDRTTKDFDAIVSRVAELRGSSAAANKALAILGKKLGIQVNTLKNYTRWPLGVMQDLGWTSKHREKVGGGRTVQIHRLTTLGRTIADYVERSVDIRVDQVDKLPFEQRRSLSRHAHFAMLGRAGFDVPESEYSVSAGDVLLRTTLRALGVSSDRSILFSPFQSLSIEDLFAIFPRNEVFQGIQHAIGVREGSVVGRGSRAHLFVTPIFVSKKVGPQQDELVVLRSKLRTFLDAAPTVDAAARAFAKSREGDTQTEFYPLVVQLLRLLGFDSARSRVGVNYQRCLNIPSF